MLVRLHMSKHVLTIDDADSAVSALRTMRNRGIRHLPVTRDGALRGMVTERDLLRVLPGFVASAPNQKDSSIPLGSALCTELISVEPNATMHTAAQILLEHKISGLPVMHAGKLVGILTSDDVLRSFTSIFEYSKGIQLTMVHGSGSRAKQGFSPAETCQRLGLKLTQLVHHGVRRGAEVFVLVVESTDSELRAFIQAASEFGWLPVKKVLAGEEDEAADEAAA